jgi:hypothetical protein
LNSIGFFGSRLNWSGLPKPDSGGLAPPVGGKNRFHLLKVIDGKLAGSPNLLSVTGRPVTSLCTTHGPTVQVQGTQHQQQLVASRELSLLLCASYVRACAPQVSDQAGRGRGGGRRPVSVTAGRKGRAWRSTPRPAGRHWIAGKCGALVRAP